MSAALTNAQVAAIRAVAAAIVETVRAAEPLGAPGGVIYAALMTNGCTLRQYEGLMSGLVHAGQLTQDGDLYHLAKSTPAH